jgi:DNA-binding transcriptional ArsR family regulator
MVETGATRGAQGELDEALLKAISHPLRHRLLGLLDDRVASPNELARELGVPLGRVSYHIRLLHDLGAIELVRTEPRRGALEHFYTAVMRAWFDDEEWARLPRAARRGILGQSLQRIFSEVGAAIEAGGFDHPASHVLRESLSLDEQGLASLSDLLTATFARAREIGAESAARAAAADGSSAPLTTELALLHFEQPS